MLEINKKYIDNEIKMIISWLNGMLYYDRYIDYQNDVETIKSWIKQLGDTIDSLEIDEEITNKYVRKIK